MINPDRLGRNVLYMHDPCQEETQSSIIFDGLLCSFAENQSFV